MSRIRTNLITNRMANGAPTVSNGLVVSGVTTSTSFSGDGSALTGIDTDLVADTSPQLGGDLDTNSHEIFLDASHSLKLATNQGQIYHSGSQMYIGTNDLRITNYAVNETMAKFVANGAVELYHNDSKKFETTSSGATLTGDLYATSKLLIGTTTEGQVGADDLTLATSGNTGITIRSGTSNAGNLYFSDATTGTGEYAGYVSYSHSTNSLSFGTNDGTERLRINSSGGVSIGNNPTVHSDTIFHVEKSSGETNVKFEGNDTMGARLSLHNNSTSGSANNQLAFCDAGGQSTSTIIGYNTDQTNNYGELVFATRNAQGTPPQERMRISKDGYVTLPNTPAASAYVGSSSPGASNNKIQNAVLGMNGTHYNNGGHYNTSNYRFTCPVAGYYKVSYSTNLHTSNLSDGQNYQVNLRVNGSVRHIHYGTKQSSHTWIYISFAETVFCSANDYIDLLLNGSAVLGVDSSSAWNRGTFELIG